jgi:hypothetical protein
MHATEKQIAYINALVRQVGFQSGVCAVDDYGLGIRSVGSLTKREASLLIDWLKTSPTPRGRETA